jgi:hypothetical protein
MSAIKEHYHDEIERGIREAAQVPCKISAWGCVYHACMTDDCQKKKVLQNTKHFGKGKCEE